MSGTLRAKGGVVMAGDRVEEDDQVDSAFLTVQEVHGLTIRPVLNPRDNYTVVYAMGPFVVVWDAKGDRKKVLRQHRTAITALAFSPDGSMLVTADAEEVLVWHPPTWSVTTVTARPARRDDRDSAEGGKTTRIRDLLFVESGAAFLSLERCLTDPANQSLRLWTLPGKVVGGIGSTTQEPLPSAECFVDQEEIVSAAARSEGWAVALCSPTEVSSWACNERVGGRPGGMRRRWGVLREDAEPTPGEWTCCAVVSKLGWTVVGGSSGTLLVFDDSGARLRVVKREGAVLTCCRMLGDDGLLVGTAQGATLWLHLPSLDLWKQVLPPPTARAAPAACAVAPLGALTGA